MTGSTPVLLLLSGGLVLLIGALILGWRSARRRTGRLVSSDLPTQPGPLLRSERYRLSGRPDELRALADGRWVPVEFKSRPSPAVGPPFSHRMQVAAYCLLVEESTGRAPPFGVVRYGDGHEFRIAWTDDLRKEVLELRRTLAQPYDGRATPSAARCRRCGWRNVCDRAAG